MSFRYPFEYNGYSYSLVIDHELTPEEVAIAIEKSKERSRQADDDLLTYAGWL